MIVSWDWLKQYVDVDAPIEEVERRLMMSGLNHEGTEPVGDDFAIDLEVTSNRPDCLGHLGVAREVAVLFDTPLKIPTVDLPTDGPDVSTLTSVEITCPDLCPRYTARVIRGVRVGPSPAWLVDRLATLNCASVNNIVDATNYVMFECGQPLHAFDYDRLAENRIIVRAGNKGEAFQAINHHHYELDSSVCTIADARQAVGLGAVMGGAESEVANDTTNILLEVAEFDSTTVRATARRLNLHSDSSFRFERGLDSHGVDWASRRCCQLILEIAGGELADGVVDVGRPPAPREPIALRFAQLSRIIGIDIAPDIAADILVRLGCTKESQSKDELRVVPPTWRRDLAREIDLVEEVARIHGYDQIPENVQVPMTVAPRRDVDRVLDRVRHVLTAHGFDEALTTSAVDETTSESFSPWTDAPPLVCETPVLRGADRMRRSLIPSLLEAHATNQSLGNDDVALFEVARVYLSTPAGLPAEPLHLGLVADREFTDLKGILDALRDNLRVTASDPTSDYEAKPYEHPLFASAHAAKFQLGDDLVAYVGVLDPAAAKKFGLRRPPAVAEIRLQPYLDGALLTPIYQPVPTFPAIDRDINLVVPENTAWADVASLVRGNAGPAFEQLDYQETYRSKDVGKGRKSFLFRVRFRDAEKTLTNQEVDEVRDSIVAACQKNLSAELRAS